MPAARRVLTSDGVRLSVVETRPESGRDTSALLVCLVPGWTMPASLWSAQMATLGASFRVAAIDPRGQGESEIAVGGYTIDRRADDIAECIAALSGNGESGVVLVGWSLGALESLHCIARHGTDGIAGLVLVDSGLGMDAPQAEPRAPLPRDTAFRDALARDRRATMRRFLRDMVRRPWTEDELARLEEAVLRMPLQASLDLFPAHLPGAHWRSIVESFAPPLLYAVTPQFAAQAAILRARRPATRVELFEQAGHALFLDEPQRFGAVLQAFVESLNR